jgi:hypothetical protein
MVNIMLLKSDYVEMLRRGNCIVVFEKKDHTYRTMNCTLDINVIESNGLTPIWGGSIVPDYQVRCIDIDILQWRSFNIDSIISFNKNYPINITE